MSRLWCGVMSILVLCDEQTVKWCGEETVVECDEQTVVWCDKQTGIV